MQLQNKTHCLIKVALVTAFSLFSLTACKGIGHSIGGTSDDIGRAAAKVKKIDPPPKIPALPINTGTQRAYKVVDVRQSGDEFIASVDTINGLYEIYVDCRAGVITRGETMPSTEQVSFVRNVCSSVTQTSSSPSSIEQASDVETEIQRVYGEGAVVDYRRGELMACFCELEQGCTINDSGRTENKSKGQFILTHPTSRTWAESNQLSCR
ncbi:hypothetical protein [Phormidesmis priestleyi]